MANDIFLPGREGLIDGSIDLDTATIKAALVRGYAYNSAHKFVSDLTGAGGSLVASFTLGSKSVTNGVFDAADGTFGAVAAGASIDLIVIYQSSAVGGGADVAATAQRLIAKLDAVTGLPIAPNGAELTCTWNNGTDKIIRLYVP